MLFGVCNGPSTFQRLMQSTMGDLIFQVMLVYLDNILVYSGRLKEAGLKVKLEKCSFLQEKSKVNGSSDFGSRHWQ